MCARVHACARVFWGVVKKPLNAAWNRCFFCAAVPDLVAAQVRRWYIACTSVHACARLFRGVVKKTPNEASNRCFF